MTENDRQADERAIRALVAQWIAASEAADTEAVLDLMSEDAVFLLPGLEPFNKHAFASMSEALAGAKLACRGEIRELRILDGWAWLCNYLEVAVTPPGAAEPIRRAGHTLTLLRKEADGRWRLARDANLLSEI